MSICKSQVRYREQKQIVSNPKAKKGEEAFVIEKDEHRCWKERFRDGMRKGTEAGADRLDLFCYGHKAIEST